MKNILKMTAGLLLGFSLTSCAVYSDNYGAYGDPYYDNGYYYAPSGYYGSGGYYGTMDIITEMT